LIKGIRKEVKRECERAGTYCSWCACKNNNAKQHCSYDGQRPK